MGRLLERRRSRGPRSDGTAATSGAEVRPSSGKRKASRRVFAVIAGGGTAGHVLPGLAIAEALVVDGRPRESVRFLGAARGMEATLVPDKGFDVTLLPLHGLQRRLSWFNVVGNVRATVELALGSLRTARLFWRWSPRVVVSVGGYGSVPAVLAARLWRIPVIVISYDAVPGRATAMAARHAAVCAVAFPGSKLSRAVVTGA